MYQQHVSNVASPDMHKDLTITQSVQYFRKLQSRIFHKCGTWSRSFSNVYSTYSRQFFSTIHTTSLVMAYLIYNLEKSAVCKTNNTLQYFCRWLISVFHLLCCIHKVCWPFYRVTSFFSFSTNKFYQIIIHMQGKVNFLRENITNVLNVSC